MIMENLVKEEQGFPKLKPVEEECCPCTKSVCNAVCVVVFLFSLKVKGFLDTPLLQICANFALVVVLSHVVCDYTMILVNALWSKFSENTNTNTSINLNKVFLRLVAAFSLLVLFLFITNFGNIRWVIFFSIYLMDKFLLSLVAENILLKFLNFTSKRSQLAGEAMSTNHVPAVHRHRGTSRWFLFHVVLIYFLNQIFSTCLWIKKKKKRFMDEFQKGFRMDAIIFVKFFFVAENILLLILLRFFSRRSNLVDVAIELMPTKYLDLVWICISIFSFIIYVWEHF